MADTTTPNYGITKPDPKTALMSAFETYINAGWSKLEDIPAPPSGTTLPQSGSYNLGDRFYKSDTKSIYILVAKDADWGWHWRPIHDAISPWLTIPTTAMVNAVGWTLNPVAANPFAIALDNRGNCYWRGVIGPSVGNIARNSSVGVFKPLPSGIRPSRQGAFMLGHETLAVGTDGTNLNSWQGVRLFVFDSKFPSANQSVRAFGGTADFNRVHLTGIHYAVGTAQYISP